MSEPLRLHLCTECEGLDQNAFDTLQRALKTALPGKVEVRKAPCLDLCDTPAALTFQQKGGAGYAFSGIDPEADSADIIATCRAYLESPDGWIEDARPCGRLRFCLAARLPA